MKPKLRFPEFTGEWNPTFLGDMASVTKLAGFEFTKHVQYSDEGKIIALRGLNVKGLKLDLSDVKYIDKSDFSMLGRSKLIVGDIIFTYIGTIGNTALIPENDRFYLAPNVALIRMHSALNTFLVQILHSDNYHRKEIAKHITSSSQPALSMQSIRNFVINIPTINEQLKISNLLNTVDQKINLLTKKKEALEAYKKGLMQKIFSQELRFKREDGTDFDLWSDFKFETICKRENSGITNRELALEGITAVYGAAGNIEGYSDGHSQPSAYVSIVKDGAGVGRVRLMPKGTSTTGTLDIIKPEVEHATAHFLYLILSTVKWERFMVGSTIPHIYFRDWKKLCVCLPSLQEQIKISSVIARIEKQIVLLTGNIDNVQKLKKGLLQQMFV